MQASLFPRDPNYDHEQFVEHYAKTNALNITDADVKAQLSVTLRSSCFASSNAGRQKGVIVLDDYMAEKDVLLADFAFVGNQSLPLKTLRHTAEQFRAFAQGLDLGDAASLVMRAALSHLVCKFTSDSQITADAGYFSPDLIAWFLIVIALKKHLVYVLFSLTCSYFLSHAVPLCFATVTVMCSALVCCAILCVHSFYTTCPCCAHVSDGVQIAEQSTTKCIKPLISVLTARMYSREDYLASGRTSLIRPINGN